MQHRSALCLLINGLGDIVLALPALRAVREMFVGSMAIVCGKGEAPGLLSEFGDAVLSVDTTYSGAGYEFDVDRLLCVVGNQTAVFGLLSWYSTSIERLLARMPEAETYGHYPAYTHHHDYRLTEHACDLSFALCKLANPELAIDRYAEPLRLDVNAFQLAGEILDGVPRPSIRIAVHADTLAHKMVSVRTWYGFLDRLLEEELHIYIFVVGGRHLTLEAGPYKKRVIPCVDLSLQVNMGIAAQSDYFIGVDSCMLHVADIYRVPCVALFTATPAAAFGPRWSEHISVEVTTDKEISSQEIYEAFTKLRNRTEQRRLH